MICNRNSNNNKNIISRLFPTLGIYSATVSISFLLLGLTTIVSLVNNPHLGYIGLSTVQRFVDGNDNQNVITSLSKTFNSFQQYHSHGIKDKDAAVIDKDEQQQNMVLAILSGEDARNIIAALENGEGFHFHVSSSLSSSNAGKNNNNNNDGEKGDDLIVEILRDSSSSS